MSSTLEPTTTTGSAHDAGRGRRIAHWDPEDEEFWRNGGQRVATRNLVFSVLAEHIGFCVWSLWSVMVLFMGPEYGLSAADKFLLVSVPTLTGAAAAVMSTGDAPLQVSSSGMTTRSALSDTVISHCPAMNRPTSAAW